MGMSVNKKDNRASLPATLNLQRKAAITRGGAFDHAGRVLIKRLRGFDMNRTISGGLSGIARKFMEEKLAKGVQWDAAAASEIETVYARSGTAQSAPTI